MNNFKYLKIMEEKYGLCFKYIYVIKISLSLLTVHDLRLYGLGKRLKNDYYRVPE